jgi:acyl-CoA synthetase (AMP-forming)/AMP-acid ligase II
LSSSTPTTYQLADLFEAVVDAVPDRLALVAGHQRLTFAQLDERANRLANHLLGLGLAPGARVGVYAWNRAEWLELMLGAFKARLVPINVNYRYVADELAYLFDDADIEAVALERTFAPVVDELRSALPELQHVLVIEDGSDNVAPGASRYEGALAASSPTRPRQDRTSDDLYVLYTGGTTGMPKGVLWRHEDIFFAAMGGNGYGQGAVASPAGVVERVSAEELRMVTLVIPPMMHGAAQWVVFITLLGGGTVVLNTSRTFDAHEAWRTVEREGCNNITLVGDAMARPLADALDESAGEFDLSQLFAIGSGGAIFSTSVKEQLRAHLPDVLLVDSFGASETGAGAAQTDIDAGPRFAVNEWTTVLDEQLHPVAPGSGVVGRLARRGHVPLGYHKDEAKTAATFPTDADGVRWAVPGDHATVEADGTITLLGRGSGCINSGGEKIYPEEVEAALKAHPEVFDALVVGVADDRFGQRVAAVVQPRPGRTPSSDDLADHCRSKVAGYKVPKVWALVDEVHRTPSGKPDYPWAQSVVDASPGR